MSVRQYIGARYVPRFLGLWNNTTQYEALDVVDNGSGTSYIARKIVPPGTPLTNTDFWFVYGASSGAILNLQTRMDAAESDISDLENKKICLISDSYGAISGSTLKNEIEDAFAMPVTMHATSSMGFVRDAGGRTFIDVIDDFTADDKRLCKYLIVYGGINDYLATSYTQEYTAVNSFITKAKTEFPNSEIIIFGPQSSATGNLSGNQDTLIDAIQSACINNGIGYANAVDWLTVAPNSFTVNYSDNTHPSALGYKIIASRMYRYIFGDDGDITTSQIFSKYHAGDTLVYAVHNNIITFNLFTEARAYTNNSFDNMIKINPIYKPFLLLQPYKVFTYYGSDYFVADEPGTFMLGGGPGVGRFLPARDLPATTRLGVAGTAIIFGRYVQDIAT